MGSISTSIQYNSTVIDGHNIIDTVKYSADNDEKLKLEKDSKTKEQESDKETREHNLTENGKKNDIMIDEQYPDYNKLYQELFDEIAIGPHAQNKRNEELEKLKSEFIESCLEDCETIIREESIKNEEDKTIKPMNGLGIARGTKFIHKNKFIKVCMDDKFLYGSKQKNIPNHIAAQKAGLNEVRASNAVTSALVKLNIQNLRTPLACVIRMNGRCFVIYALSPISKDSLIYGTGDAGKTIKNCSNEKNKEIYDKLVQLTKYFKLEPHSVKGKEMLTAADVEVHLSNDGRIYLLDLGRFFPPMTNKWGDLTLPNLYMLFRPEFMIKYSPCLVSGDAYSGFGKENKEVHNSNAKKASHYLMNILVPHLANTLRQLDKDKKLLPFPTIFSDIFHESGVNMCLLGHVWAHVPETCQEMRCLLVIEMIIRILKVELKKQLNNVKDDDKKNNSYDQIFLESVEQFIFDKFDYNNRSNNNSSKPLLFWENDIQKLLLEKYRVSVDNKSIEEAKNNICNCDTLSVEELLKRLNIKLATIIIISKENTKEKQNTKIKKEEEEEEENKIKKTESHDNINVYNIPELIDLLRLQTNNKELMISLELINDISTIETPPFVSFDQDRIVLSENVNERFYKHELFISHRGTMKSTVAFPMMAMFACLCGPDFAFFDQISLQLGDSSVNGLSKGVAASKIGLIIISDDYFTSDWCVAEAEVFLARSPETKEHVISLFHSLTPDQCEDLPVEYCQDQNGRLNDKSISFKKQIARRLTNIGLEIEES